MSTDSSSTSNSSSSSSSSATPVTTNDANVKSDNDKSKEQDPAMRWFLIAVLTTAVILIIWYAYCCFNNGKESFKKGTEQERDDPIADFNLREVLNDLKVRQKMIMSSLSEMSDL